MTLYLDLPTLFKLFCIGQGLTTAAWLFAHPTQPGNRPLAWLMLGLTLQVLDYFLSWSGVYAQYNWLYFMPLFYSWSFGPLFYNYVLARLGRAERVSRAWFGLVAVQAVFYLLLMAQPLDLKAAFWINVHKPYTRFIDYYVAGGLMLYFLWRSWRVLRQDERSRTWLGTLAKGLAVFYVIAAIEPIVNPAYLPPKAPRFYLTAYVLPLFVYALALIGLFLDVIARDRLGIAPKPQPTAPIDAGQLAPVRSAMVDAKLYRDPDLTLTSLAQHLGLTPNALSRLINAGFGQSFSDFVNLYRVEEIKQRLAAGDADRVTLLALGLDAGFSSKTTFNRVFKELTGFTPKAYQKKSQTMSWGDEKAV